MSKEITMNRDGFELKFRAEGKDGIAVDVSKDGKVVLEWAYGIVPVNKLLANALFWADQAILQAKVEMKRQA